MLEKVGRGVFSTGALVLQGPHEFAIDFVLRMAQPQQIVARVVLPVSIVQPVINALRDNLAKYQSKFGSAASAAEPAARRQAAADPGDLRTAQAA